MCRSRQEADGWDMGWWPTWMAFAWMPGSASFVRVTMRSRLTLRTWSSSESSSFSSIFPFFAFLTAFCGSSAPSSFWGSGSVGFAMAPGPCGSR